MAILYFSDVNMNCYKLFTHVFKAEDVFEYVFYHTVGSSMHLSIFLQQHFNSDKYMSFTYDEVARFYNEGISSLTTIDEAVLTFNLIERLGAEYE